MSKNYHCVVLTVQAKINQEWPYFINPWRFLSAKLHGQIFEFFDQYRTSVYNKPFWVTQRQMIEIWILSYNFNWLCCWWIILAQSRFMTAPEDWMTIWRWQDILATQISRKYQSAWGFNFQLSIHDTCIFEQYFRWYATNMPKGKGSLQAEVWNVNVCINLLIFHSKDKLGFCNGRRGKR